MKNAALNGKLYARNPHARFDEEGEVASAKPRRGSLLYNKIVHIVLPLALVCGGRVFADPVSVTNRLASGASVIVRGECAETSAPVLVWLHGGGLTGGTASFVALNDPGICQVTVDYRLMKKDGSVRASDCIDDAAAAVAWTLENAATFGGDPKKVFVSGHSAGAYLTMMVGMDPRWLAKFGHRQDEVAGLIPVSGQATKHFNVRKYAGDVDAQYLPKIDDLAPLAHVTNAIPPILSICGQPPYEWPCRAEENRLLIASLVALGHENAWYVEAPGCTHGTVQAASCPYIRDFIRGKFAPAGRQGKKNR